MSRLAFIPWYGGKSIHTKWILPLLPEDAPAYIEPFCGSAAILFNRPPTKLEVINDLNSRLIHLYQTLRDQPDELQFALMLTLHSREEYALALEDDPALDDIERARRTWIVFYQGYGGGGMGRRTPGTWKRQKNARAGKCHAEVMRDKVDNLGIFIDRLRTVQIESRDACQLIREYGTEPTTLMYCDPPYMAGTRTNGAADYAHEMGDQQHRDFLDAVNGCRARVAISGYHSDLYAEVLDGWHVHEKDVANRTAKIFAADGSVTADRRIEVLWTNYDPEIGYDPFG